jgi:non-canonical poly(A) RNA polymerase PAPD5/7
LETSGLAAPGSLHIVRGARIPIIKFVDSGGSGVQVDISMNNGSAMASTSFIQHHLAQFPLLRPLTMVLKQWLFLRRMNEVYERGGLSSYALFLLVLTVVRQHRYERIFPSEELLGRYLMQFLRQWSAPSAFAQVIRPLQSPVEKSWGPSFDLCKTYLNEI